MNPSPSNAITVETGHYGRLVVARLKPGEDLVLALQQLCVAHAISRAVVRSAVGSLVEARLARTHAQPGHSVVVPGPGVEILNAFGEITLDAAEPTTVSGMVADTEGRMYAGYFVPGANRSFITIEVTLQEWVVEKRSREVITA
jgi:uncharacterized protein